MVFFTFVSIKSCLVTSLLCMTFFPSFGEEIVMSEKTKERIANCPPVPKCTTRADIYGFTPSIFSFVDRKRKVLMEYTPKADCSSAVTGFLRSLGFEHEVDYFGWVHNFGGIYQRHCDHSTSCEYFDNSWFRFKVVRNPFERAVSSFLFVKKIDLTYRMLPPSMQSGNATFEDFVDLLDSLPMDQFQKYAAYHAGLQSRPYERYAYQHKYPPFFHEIVQAEHPDAALNRIYAKTNVSYVLKYAAKHYQPRKDVEQYVGNLTWNEVQQKVPHDYGWFYNQRTKDKIEKLFLWDLLIYNYSYPYLTPFVK